MCIGTHQLLGPTSLGVHSVSYSDSVWLPEDQHTWLACCPHFYQRIQHSYQVTCAFAIGIICKVSLPTFLDTLGFQEEKWLFTAGALLGPLALQTVAVTAWKTEVKSTRTCMALQGLLALMERQAGGVRNKEQYKLVCWARKQTNQDWAPGGDYCIYSWVTKLLTPLLWASAFLPIKGEQTYCPTQQPEERSN